MLPAFELLSGTGIWIKDARALDGLYVHSRIKAQRRLKDT